VQIWVDKQASLAVAQGLRPALARRPPAVEPVQVRALVWVLVRALVLALVLALALALALGLAQALVLALGLGRALPDREAKTGLPLAATSL